MIRIELIDRRTESCGHREITELSAKTIKNLTPSSPKPDTGMGLPSVGTNSGRAEQSFLIGSGQRSFIDSHLNQNLQGEGNG